MNYSLLINKNYKMKDEYLKYFNLISVSNELGENILIEEETYNHFLKLKEYLESINIIVGINNSYRSVENQQKIYDDYLDRYGLEFTKKYVAIPGESEHHTGLAIDLMLNVDGDFVREDDKLFFYEDIFNIIHNVLYKYGFILRYPKGKEIITGYGYEPWHIRYVGTSISKKICDNNLTLEEFLNL